MRKHEPLNVDLYFDGKEMTEEDQKRVSDFIAKQKEMQIEVDKLAKEVKKGWWAKNQERLLKKQP